MKHIYMMDDLIMNIKAITKITVTQDQDLFDLGIKSTQAVQLIFKIKKQYPSIKDKIKTSDLELYRNVKDIAEYLCKLLDSA
uniref:Carrier domain-containing protein n=1 Tax=Megaviridae environmental sample TaxID=1737588 RepID=A0A5J6VI84_9VIRU|nr:MAG: hypothetical protein [Megaviridae environmental sample]